MKYLVLQSRIVGALVLGRVKAAAQGQARRAVDIHPAAAALVPQAYAEGAPGWTVPWAVEAEVGSSRIAIIAEDGFASGKTDLALAVDKLPTDWQRGEGFLGIARADGKEDP